MKALNVLWVFFRLPAKSLKILLTIGMIFGVAAAYTAYKAEDASKENVSKMVKMHFSGVIVARNTEAGPELVKLYDKAIKAPDYRSLVELYSRAQQQASNDSGVLSIPEKSVLQKPEFDVTANPYVTQLKFVDRPITSGSILGVALFLLMYGLVVVLRGIKNAAFITAKSVKAKLGTAH
jgi:hypothetical protein